MLPQGALENWFKSFTATYAVDHIDVVHQLAVDDRAAAIQLVADATKRHSKKAADQGTVIHGYCELIMLALLEGRKPQFQVSKEDMGYLRNFARFITEFEVEPVMVETTVWNDDPSYAGTFDLMCKLKGYPGLSIVDYKTGASGVYAETGIQQIAYMRAESYITEDGNFKPMPEVNQAFGLWLRDTGFALFPLRTDDYVWSVFLHLNEIFDYVKNEAPSIVGKPINKNVLKKVWRPR